MSCIIKNYYDSCCENGGGRTYKNDLWVCRCGVEFKPRFHGLEPKAVIRDYFKNNKDPFRASTFFNWQNFNEPYDYGFELYSKIEKLFKRYEKFKSAMRQVSINRNRVEKVKKALKENPELTEVTISFEQSSYSDNSLVWIKEKQESYGKNGYRQQVFEAPKEIGGYFKDIYRGIGD